MAEKLRVGVIGCGAIAQIMHIPYLIDHDDKFELVAIADSYTPVLVDVAERYKIAHRYANWHDLIARKDIDAVVICHSGSHRDTVIASVAAGKHVFVEKPLTWSAGEAEAVVDAVAKSDRMVQVAYHKLYDPAFPVAKEAVDQIDDLAFVRITVLHPTNDLGFSPHRIRRGGRMIQEGHQEPPSWEDQAQRQLNAFAMGELQATVDEALGSRKDDNRLRVGYGNITVSLIHQIYMMYGFLGEPVRVVSTDIWREGLSIHAIVEYPNDIRCTLDWHFLSHLKDYREEYLFCGNHKRVRLDFPGPYFRNFPSPVTIQGGEGELAWEKRIIVSLDEAFEREILAFYDCVTQQKMPRTTVQDAVKHMHFVQQLIDAAR